MTVNDTDKFLVNRSNTSFHLEAQNMAELQDTDLMLVNRGGVSYKATGAEIKDSLGPKGTPNKPKIIAPADGAGMEISAESDEIIAIGDNLNGENHYELRSAGGTAWTARPSVSTATFVEDIQIGNAASVSGSNSFLVFAFDAQVSNVLIGRTSTTAQAISVFGINDANSTAWEWIATQSIEVDSYVDTGSEPYQYYMLIRTSTLPNPLEDNWYESSTIHNNTTYTSYGILENVRRVKLTLSGPKDLSGDSSFVAGDAVEQDSGHTPTSSAITSAQRYQDTYGPLKWSARSHVSGGALSSAYETTKMFDGAPGTYVVPAGVSEYVWNLTNPLKTGGHKVSIRDEFMRTSNPDTADFFSINDSGWLNTKDYPRNDSTNARHCDITDVLKSTSNPTTITQIGLKRLSSTGAAISQIYIDDQLIIDDQSYSTDYTEIILTDDTDLENFRVGDVVGPPAPSVSGDEVGFTYTGYNQFKAAADEPNGVAKDVANWAPGGSSAYATSGMCDSTDATCAAANNGFTTTWQTASAGTLRLRTQRYGGTNVELTVTGDFTSGPSTITSTNSTTSFNEWILPAQGKVIFTHKQSHGVIWSQDSTFNGSPINLASIVRLTALVTAIDESAPSITTDGGTWTPGDVVTGPDTTPATGTVASTDPVANTITLATSDEASPKRWIVNQGKFVKGPPSPSKDAAPDASGLELFSSAFKSTPANSLGQTGASWQVAAYDDINFATPVAQEIESTTDLTQWPVVPELAADTQYRCRVQHISSDQKSEWSDASTFKTQGDQPNVISRPGRLWSADKGTLAFRTSPAKLSMLSITDTVLAVGLDGNVVQAANANSNLTLLANPVNLNYTPLSATAAYGTAPTLYVRPNGKLDSFNVDGSVVTSDFEITAGEKVTRLSLATSSIKTCAVTESGHIYYADGAATGSPGWTKTPDHPTGAKFIEVAAGAYYKWDGTHNNTSDTCIFGVTDDGKLWQFVMPSTTVWEDTGVTGIKTACCLFRSGLYYYALKEDGSEVLVGGQQTTPSPSSFAAPAGDEWRQIGGSYLYGQFLTKSGRIFLHAQDGNSTYNFAPTVTNSTTANELFEMDAPAPINSLSMQQTTPGGYNIGFIIPD